MHARSFGAGMTLSAMHHDLCIADTETNADQYRDQCPADVQAVGGVTLQLGLQHVTYLHAVPQQQCHKHDQ